MSISRRAFVTGLFGAAAAVPLLARVEGLALHDVATAPVLDQPATLGTYEAVLAEARRLFDATYTDLVGAGHRYVVVNESHRVGDRCEADGAVFTDQLNVSFQTHSVDGAIGPAISAKHALPAAMHCMAVSSVERGLGQFGRLISPNACEYAAMSGPLRMVVSYDIMTDAYLARFDVLGAKTPAVERVALSQRCARAKAAIKQRLTVAGQASCPVNPFWSRA